MDMAWFTLKLLFVFTWWIAVIASVGSTNTSTVRRFIQTPGDFAVLENTTAVFDWRHTILNLRNVTDHGVNKTSHNIGITWFYRGKNKEQFTLIMSYTSSDGLYKAPSNKNMRLSYTEGLDSAAMRLDRVTFNDEGFYEVRVVDNTDPVPGGFYISDVAKMTVTEGDTHIHVTVRNDSFDLANGSDIRLPSLPVSVPERVYLSISVSQKAPLPDILMTTSVGDVTRQELPCGKACFCERDIPLMADGTSRHHGLIQVIVIANVQNQNNITVDVPLEFAAESKSATPWYIFMNIAFFVVMIALNVLFWKFGYLRLQGNSSKCLYLRKCNSANNDISLRVPAESKINVGSEAASIYYLPVSQKDG